MQITRRTHTRTCFPNIRKYVQAEDQSRQDNTIKEVSPRFVSFASEVTLPSVVDVETSLKIK